MDLQFTALTPSKGAESDRLTDPGPSRTIFLMSPLATASNQGAVIWLHLMVEMAPFIHEGHLRHEYRFCLVWGPTTAPRLGHTYDSLEAARILPPDARPVARKALHRLTARLLAHRSPPSFFMTTALPHLPERALRKYEELCEIFTSSGYDIAPMVHKSGFRDWEMIRNAP